MKQKILIVGVSGSMGRLVAERILASDKCDLMSFGVVAPDERSEWVTVGNTKLRCIPINEVNADIFRREQFIIIDFTHKDVIGTNWEKYYKKWSCPLIVGTIGVKKADFIGNTAPVIIGSPNLCPQIVEVLRTFSSLEEGSLKDIQFEITESHQASKKEVSGTAVRMQELFRNAGAIEKSPIHVIRRTDEQLKIGVPQKYLNGHGWHKYSFSSENDEQVNYLVNICYPLFQRITTDDVVMEDDYFLGSWENSSETLFVELRGVGANIIFTHNINGRVPYIDGLFNAVLPTMAKMIASGDNSVKDMFDL
jgi:4-hydroxy-tetrahydrodipicolinate reductase